MKRTLLAMLSGAALLIAAPLSHAMLLEFHAVLNGANEAPPNASTGTGFAVVDIDDVAHTMHVHVDFTGLVAPNTAAHIHCCTAVPLTGTAGVATSVPTFTGFPGGVTFGTYDHIFDMTLPTSYNPAFDGPTSASDEATLFAGMIAGRTYLNIHSSTFPGGEIRGFLVPEPGTIALLGLGLGAGWLMRRRRRI